MEEFITRIIPVCALSLVLICISQPAQTQVYEWIDANGQKQFSDQPPSSGVDADSKTYEILNIDESLPPPMVVDTEKGKNKKRYAAAKKAYLTKECKKARDYLKKTQGRVVFTDDDGKDVYVSEKERIRRVRELGAEITKHCE
ncbi:MAG: DUF4124 domain-containing protein [Gammaproteobacteria bacterium]|jgi:hypothetical protein|nr:DUF4124 domain-containing protein [Gammaproteobacteria bacterium]MBT7369378.1 DUF4124 domain-containing protein [Gammaproteobacteria bacterium]